MKTNTSFDFLPYIVILIKRWLPYYLLLWLPWSQPTCWAPPSSHWHAALARVNPCMDATCSAAAGWEANAMPTSHWTWHHGLSGLVQDAQLLAPPRPRTYAKTLAHTARPTATRSHHTKMVVASSELTATSSARKLANATPTAPGLPTHVNKNTKPFKGSINNPLTCVLCSFI